MTSHNAGNPRRDLRQITGSGLLSLRDQGAGCHTGNASVMTRAVCVCVCVPAVTMVNKITFLLYLFLSVCICVRLLSLSHSHTTRSN